MASPASRDADGRGRGFVLLIVLWALVLIALIAGHIAASGRVEVQIAGNLSVNAAAEAARDGAIRAAIANLANPNAKARWPADGQPHRMEIGDSRVILRVADEAGRVNPSLAPPELLEALLVVTGNEAAAAHRLAQAVGQWVGADPANQDPDAAASAYQNAGLGYSPPLELLESIDELTRVIGMTPEIVAALRPHLTLFGPAQPDPAAADAVVRAALDYLAKQPPALGAPAVQTPPTPSASRTVRITAEAQGPGNAVSSGTEIVRLSDANNGSYVLLAWQNASE